MARAAAAGALGRQVASQNGGGESGTERVDSGEAGSIHGSAAAAVAVAATRAGRIDFRNGRWYVFNPEHADSTGPVLGTAEGAAGLFEGACDASRLAWVHWHGRQAAEGLEVRNRSR